MSIGNVAPQEKPEIVVISSNLTCPACEFATMKQTAVSVEHDVHPSGGWSKITREYWECRGCGHELEMTDYRNGS